MTKSPIVAFALSAALGVGLSARAADPLPSWNDGQSKQSITTFVEKVTKPGSPDFVPLAERIPPEQVVGSSIKRAMGSSLNK